jgi:hypothetical protein
MRRFAQTLLVVGIVAGAWVPTASADAPARAPASQVARGDAPRWPAEWRAIPSTELQGATKAAAEEYGVPILLLYAVMFVETGGTFKSKVRGKYHAGNSARFAKSYAVRRGQRIPGSSVRWGEKFRPEDYRPIGIMQVNPYHIWGVVLSASAPLEAGYEVLANMRAGARVLRVGFDSGGTWIKALRAYNWKPAFRRAVLSVYRALGGDVASLGRGGVAFLETFRAAQVA